MPKYTFKCECNETKTLYVAFDAEVKCQCGRLMVAALPNISKATVTEKVDKMTGTNWIKDQKEILQERSEDYFWAVEVPRFVESGVYSIETCLERNWIYKDAKGNFQTRTKPPDKG